MQISKSFFLTIFILGCTSQEQIELREQGLKKLKQDIIPYGHIQLQCTKASMKVLPVKRESYTKMVPQVTGTEKTGSHEHCWSDVYGNEWCNEIETKKDIITMVPFQFYRDKNLAKREEFMDACGCVNSDYEYLAHEDFRVGDTTYSAEYLSGEWQNCVMGRYGDQAHKCYNVENAGRAVEKTIYRLEARKTDRFKHCKGKEGHFRQQPWYKKIPSVK